MPPAPVDRIIELALAEPRGEATHWTGLVIVPSLPSIRRVTPRLAMLSTACFVLIGLGFMVIEIGLIQPISIYLGHPVYGMSIALFGIIVSTGLGSLSIYHLRC